jgi:hypothetical protein
MTKTRLDYIDGLRGIAVSAVFVQHVADYVMERAPGRSSVLRMIFVDSFDSGRFGIALFFLISGFVIPFSFRRPSAVLRFIITRFFRLYPAYWLSLATAIIVLYTFFSVNIGLDTILFNFTMFEMAFGRPVVLGPYWTLIIELIFYAMSTRKHPPGGGAPDGIPAGAGERAAASQWFLCFASLTLLLLQSAVYYYYPIPGGATIVIFFFMTFSGLIALRQPIIALGGIVHKLERATSVVFRFIAANDHRASLPSVSFSPLTSTTPRSRPSVALSFLRGTIVDLEPRNAHPVTTPKIRSVSIGGER